MTGAQALSEPGVWPRVISGAGLAGAAAGAGAWMLIRAQLAAEKIDVPDGAGPCAGRRVTGPRSAFAEAEFIRKTALAATGGRAYGEIEEGDPAGPVARDAALLRASLFTSILAFGVAAAGMVVGAVLAVIGRLLAVPPGSAGRR